MVVYICMDGTFERLEKVTPPQTMSLPEPQPSPSDDEDDEQTRVDELEFDGNWSERISTASTLISSRVSIDDYQKELNDESGLYQERLRTAATILVRDMMQATESPRNLRQKFSAGTTDWQWTLM